MSAEEKRLREDAGRKGNWKRWGPYLSERQWGTVREDYSATGECWSYFPHDHARSRAYRWGEDGLMGVCDRQGRLCFALALWNGRDPILKERLFGLTGPEGNHGEDVKECYYYLDSTPTHSYMKALYKYPQAEFPYARLVEENARRSKHDPELELADTGAFDDGRYFDVFVEYAKAGPEDILVRVTAANRGPEAAKLWLLPTLWFRNTWSWGRTGEAYPKKPCIIRRDAMSLLAEHESLGRYRLVAETRPGGPGPTLLFTENETNTARLYGVEPRTPYVKDAFHAYVVGGDMDAVNPEGEGTKAAALYRLELGPGEERTLRVRLASEDAGWGIPFGSSFDMTFEDRAREADEFFAARHPEASAEEERRARRQAYAGLLWSKQFYYYAVEEWREGDPAQPAPPPGRERGRNREWAHLYNRDVISMPDKWEYPWYAAWDLAFHTLPIAIVDPHFAKEQMELMLRGVYLHPNGQLPAYEWNFSDVNPPVHAFATLFLHRTEQALRGETDLDFLKSAFNKLLLNFTWWVNRKDRFGKNVFEGGFLGLDNIGVFDRSAPLPTGGYLEQADGTAWMAFFTQNMAELAVELAAHDRNYEDMVAKFIEHFYFIAAGMNRAGQDGMWDEEDGFYYDLLRLPDGSSTRLKVRSMVGLLPLCATTVVEQWQRERIPKMMAQLTERIRRMPELRDTVHPTGPGHWGVADRGIIALINPERLRRILSKMLDENEFLSPYGIRSLSKFHERNPYVFHANGQEHRVDYLPAESNTGMFGGNSNWRGPVWMPVNAMIIRALLNFYLYYGDNFKIECPTGSGKMMNLFEVSKEIADRLTRIFLRDAQGRRPVYGGTETFQTDPHWRDCILFYEYFHGDNGAGLGASHQTGWTGLVAKIIQLYGLLDPQRILEGGKMAAFGRVAGGR
ncbi:MAG: glucosidase [Kofleriaceae bacterium]|nr:glucosidase [Candidatus Methylomirabilis lanthanidiphila]